MAKRKKKRTKRLQRVLREAHRLGSKKSGHGWAAKQAAKHGTRGRSSSTKKKF